MGNFMTHEITVKHHVSRGVSTYQATCTCGEWTGRSWSNHRHAHNDGRDHVAVVIGLKKTVEGARATVDLPEENGNQRRERSR